MHITVVGCGAVGATTAYALTLDGIAQQITLIDIEKGVADGLVLDLEHCLRFTPFTKLSASNQLSAAKGSDLIIVTAGRRQGEGETRLDLCSKNKKIFGDIIPPLAQAAPNAIFLIISNPVDVLTYTAIKLGKLPWQRVFGSGTMLDTARFQFHLSQRLGVNPHSIDAYILGEHGDTSFPVLSSANIMGKPLFDFPGFTQKIADECYDETWTAAYRIINDRGFTCYSIATAIRALSRAIANDTHEVFVVSVSLRNYYGHSNVAISVPAVIGKEGIVQTLEIPLNEKEQAQLSKSITTIKSLC